MSLRVKGTYGDTTFRPHPRSCEPAGAPPVILILSQIVLLKLREFLFDFFSKFCYNIYIRKGEMRMLDDFIMNFSYDEQEDKYLTPEEICSIINIESEE